MKLKKRIIYLLALAVCAALLLTACAQAQSGSTNGAGQTDAESGAIEKDDDMEQGEYHKITAEEAKKMMDAGGVTVVDVRTEAEYAEGHISGAVLVPVESIADEAPDGLPDKDAVLLVYCRSGRRSKLASEQLLELGYKNVYDFGGIIDWPYEVVAE